MYYVFHYSVETGEKVYITVDLEQPRSFTLDEAEKLIKRLGAFANCYQIEPAEGAAA